MTTVRGVLLKEGKALFVKRKKTCEVHPGFWQFPGGSVEREEGFLDAVRREVKEETNLEFRNALPMLVVDNCHFYIGDFHGELLVDDHDLDLAAWLTYEQLKDLPKSMHQALGVEKLYNAGLLK